MTVSSPARMPFGFSCFCITTSTSVSVITDRSKNKLSNFNSWAGDAASPRDSIVSRYPNSIFNGHPCHEALHQSVPSYCVPATLLDLITGISEVQANFA